MNLAFLVAAVLIGADEPKKPLFAAVDLDRGETVRVRLPDGGQATVKLVDIKETRDSLRETLRRAEVTVEINGRTTTVKQVKGSGVFSEKTPDPLTLSLDPLF